MQTPTHFPRVVGLSTLLMGGAFAGIGAIGYWCGPPATCSCCAPSCSAANFDAVVMLRGRMHACYRNAQGTARVPSIIIHHHERERCQISKFLSAIMSHLALHALAQVAGQRGPGRDNIRHRRRLAGARGLQRHPHPGHRHVPGQPQHLDAQHPHPARAQPGALCMHAPLAGLLEASGRSSMSIALHAWHSSSLHAASCCRPSREGCTARHPSVSKGRCVA